jgi:hypothetical protein
MTARERPVRPALRSVAFALAACFALGGSAAIAETVQSSPPARTPLGGVAFDERLDRDPLLLPALPRSTADLPPLVVRIALDLSGIPTERLAPMLADLDRRINGYAGRRVRIVLSLGAFPASDDDVESWRQSIRTVAEHGRGKVAGYQIGQVTGPGPPAVERYVFLLKLASVQLRSVDADALVIQGSVPASLNEWQATLYGAGIAPYVDGLAVAGPPAADDEAFRASVERVTAIVAREDETASVVLGPVQLSGTADTVSARFFDAEVQSLGTAVRITSYAGNVPAIRAALGVAARAADLLSGAVVTIDERAAGLRLSRGSTDLTSAIPHRLLFSTTRFATYLVYGGRQETMPLDVEVSVADATTPQVRDAVTGSVEKPLRAETRQGTRISLTVPVARRPLILDFNAGATDRVVESAEVQKETLPSVAEIIARHQQAQAAQDGALTRYIAHMRLEQHFHPSAADPSYNIVTENRVFFERGAVEWEELSFAFNGATWTSNRPSFPLVQPEKVLSLPLDLRLSQDYTYRLEGVDTVMGRPAYVVRFEPVGSGRALYRGTAWIDREQFVRLRVQAVESRLTGMVVSNDETSTFSRVGELNGRPVWLLDRLSSKQMFLIAGRTVLVEREARVTDVTLNPPQFEAERTEARASNRIMYRDTDQGLRYLVKRGDARIVSEQMTTSTKAFALGAQVDPSFDYPLPIGGLDLLDFNFLHRDMQFALLFAGVFAAGNIQRPNLWGGHFDASVDFFGLAVGSNDAIFDAQAEQTGERVRRVPGSTGLNIGFQATPFQKILGHYEFRFDAFFRDPKTATDFTLPASAGTHGVGLGYEYRRAGYSIVGNIMKHRRTTAEPWGPAGALQAAPRTFTKYDLGVSKDFIFATFHTIHLNGAYFGGERLDRFSMYQFGLFDAARLHGVPSTVRFGELAMFRGSYSFNLFEQYRVDLFVDHARGRDALAGGWAPVTGLGLGLNLRTPRNTILRADLGKSILPEAYRGAGSIVLQIMLLKPL